MAHSEEEKRRIEAAIARQSARFMEIHHEFTEMQALHMAAWSAYGSELCGGEMSDKEFAVLDRLKAVGHDLALLRSHLKGEIAAPEVTAAVEVGLINAEIASLEAERKSVEETNAVQRRLAALLAVPSVE